MARTVTPTRRGQSHLEYGRKVSKKGRFGAHCLPSLPNSQFLRSYMSFKRDRTLDRVIERYGLLRSEPLVNTEGNCSE